jgi:hypothetical protein
MNTLATQIISAYRARTFLLKPEKRLKSQQDAIDFVNERGFVFFWPIKDILLPSLWAATAGDRPVPDVHDDPGHITWRWKDALLGSQAWYYAKVLRKKSTMIAMDVVPFFYALSENYGSPEEDHLILYEQGKLTLEAKLVYQALLDEGPLNTITLKKVARLSSAENESRFNRALSDLQADFKIVPVGVSEAGAWKYAFIYDIVTRIYPELIEKTRFISEEQAREKLLELYILSLGVVNSHQIVKLFHWDPFATAEATKTLIRKNIIRPDIHIEGQENNWLTLSSLMYFK